MGVGECALVCVRVRACGREHQECVYVCVHAWAGVYVCVCVRERDPIFPNIDLDKVLYSFDPCRRVCVCVSACVCMCVCLHACMCACVCVCVCV